MSESIANGGDGEGDELTRHVSTGLTTLGNGIPRIHKLGLQARTVEIFESGMTSWESGNAVKLDAFLVKNIAMEVFESTAPVFAQTNAIGTISTISGQLKHRHSSPRLSNIAEVR